ncbi:MAG: phosphopentomutase/phosphoglucosamine mutase [Methanomicrobiales archaeon]
MLFGSSGIRRRFDLDLIRIALQTGSALGSRGNNLILGTDTRTTNNIISSAFISGFLSSGGNVETAGIVPTPVVAYASRYAAAGCMVTASHNPEEYNGMKLFNPDGSSFTKIQQESLSRKIEISNWSDWASQGELSSFDSITPFTKSVQEKVHISHELKVVLDCGCGAGSTVSPGLLSDLGVTPVCLNCHPGGHFARPSEPVESNLQFIPGMMNTTGAKVAVVHDGDADRMMAFDEKCRYINGDLLLMLFTSYLGAKKVVTTVDASMAIEEMTEVRRTPVGDSFVSEELLSWGEFGGEPSGAWIFPKQSYCPDGPYAAALFCEIASEWNIADTLDTMPHYPILRESVSRPDSREILLAIGAENPTNGIRLSSEDGWCLVRASGTEPKIRFTAEGRTLRKAKEMLEHGQDLVRKGKTA